MPEVVDLVARAETLLARIELLLPAPPAAVDWKASIAFRWRKKAAQQALEPIYQVHRIDLRDLQGIDEQKNRVEANTRQFVDGYPANNVLLTGARGTGKSSLIKALLNKYAPRGLRLIEVEKRDLTDLPDIVELIHARPERFILYCDDLSFEADEPGYKALKVVLDGSVAAASENCLIYATSNRRHLMPEFMHENLEYQHVGEEIHPGETSEEKVSLSERFGLWVSFYPFDQDEYLRIVHVWLAHFKITGSKSREVEHAALQWALARGSRSGRVAWQFARDWAGRTRLARRK
ncbi:MAG: ATP-binding protein [Betaproteobacteria bacterium]|nr:MAG: ATP-binding protein [Betaproteobacteria bacterium]